MLNRGVVLSQVGAVLADGQVMKVAAEGDYSGTRSRRSRPSRSSAQDLRYKLDMYGVSGPVYAPISLPYFPHSYD